MVKYKKETQNQTYDLKNYLMSEWGPEKLHLKLSVGMEPATLSTYRKSDNHNTKGQRCVQGKFSSVWRLK